MAEYLNKQILEEITTKDLTIDAERGILVKIRSIDPAEFLALFPDVEVPDDEEKAKDALAEKIKGRPMKENMDMIDDIVIRGMIQPKVTRDGSGDSIPINSLAGYKMKIMEGILEFSGLKGGTIESFRQTPSESGGGTDGGKVRG